MGALLIAGVTPIPGCIEIPGEASCLSDPGLQANPHSLNQASKVLKHWVDYWLDDMDMDEDERPVVTSAAVDPFDFLNWCLEEYENVSVMSTPSWLRYWLSFTKMEFGSNVPPPAPADLVARAAELEGFASVVHSKAFSAEHTTNSNRQSSEAKTYVARMSEMIRKKARTPIAESIIRALVATDDPYSNSAVWVELCKLANSNSREVLRPVDECTFEVPQKKGRGWKIYTRDALDQFLDRYRKDAS